VVATAQTVLVSGWHTGGANGWPERRPGPLRRGGASPRIAP